jgi:glycogen debranching enzyme
MQGSGTKKDALWQLGQESIASLEDERGILASSREEVYGCVFGRDSLISGLKLLRVYQSTGDEYYLGLVRKILSSLAELQGREHNIESGEEPGKIIHEFRPEKHEHLTKALQEPWYVYPDNVMRNYDSVDSTPLFLMLMHEYYRQTRDEVFVQDHLWNITLALEWMLTYGDSNGDGLLDYRFHSDRKMGGLRTQSWMDSTESVFFEHSLSAQAGDEQPGYPIAPVEVQAYAWVAMRTWEGPLAGRDASLAERLGERAAQLKRKFNESFVISRGGKVSLAFAVSDRGRKLTSPRSSMGHVLWAVHRNEQGEKECILDSVYIEPLVHRLMRPDLFVARAGIRTLSSRSRMYDPISYHNGSIWPHDTSILAEGLENFGFLKQAIEVRSAILRAYEHFGTPIELFGYSNGKFQEYETSEGGKACRVQAWSAASLLSTLRALESRV